MLAATFDTEPVLRKLEAYLRGEVQEPSEPADAFIQRKLQTLGPVPNAPLGYAGDTPTPPRPTATSTDTCAYHIGGAPREAFDLELTLKPLPTLDILCAISGSTFLMLLLSFS